MPNALPPRKVQPCTDFFTGQGRVIDNSQGGETAKLGQLHQSPSLRHKDQPLSGCRSHPLTNRHAGAIGKVVPALSFRGGLIWTAAVPEIRCGSTITRSLRLTVPVLRKFPREAWIFISAVRFHA